MEDDKRENDKRYSKQSELSTILSKKVAETRDLIDAVHRRRCLWDRSDAEYRDRIAKDRAWKEIYKEMEPNYDNMKPSLRHEFGLHITKKWYNARDSYVKSRRSNRTTRPYLHSEALTFLDPIYFSEGSTSRQETFAEDRSHEDDTESPVNWINEVYIDVDENTREAKRPRIDDTKVKEEIDDSEVNIVNVLANLIQREDDDDRAFFKSITPSVKSLSQEAKLEFRIQVMKLIKLLKIKDKKGYFLKKDNVMDSDSE